MNLRFREGTAAGRSFALRRPALASASPLVRALRKPRPENAGQTGLILNFGLEKAERAAASRRRRPATPLRRWRALRRLRPEDRKTNLRLLQEAVPFLSQKKDVPDFPERLIGGGGGSRTRVQTGNPKAFYTFSRRFVLLPVSGRRLPNPGPSSLIFARRPEPSVGLSPNE